MGLHGELLEYFRRILPWAFKTEQPQFSDYVVLDDVLTRLRAHGSNSDQLVTGLQFYQRFAEPIYSALKHGCKCWVVISDIRGRVAQQKHGEQKLRDIATKKNAVVKGKEHVPYDPYCEITDHGIIVPLQRITPSDLKDGKLRENVKTQLQLIDGNKLAGSRGALREKMMDYLFAKMR